MAEDLVPELVAQLTATAAAAQVDPLLIFYLNAGGFRPAPLGRPGGCTSAASRGQGGVLIGHNEDADPAARADLFVLKARMTSGIEFSGTTNSSLLGLSYCYTLMGVSITINGHGLVCAVDALPDSDDRGLPVDFMTRCVIECDSIDAAISLSTAVPTSGGCSILMAHGSDMAIIEIGPDLVLAREIGSEDYACHTNHAILLPPSNSSSPPRADSQTRLKRCRALIHSGVSITEMKALLTDTEGFPDSIYRPRTIASAIAHTEARRFLARYVEDDSASWIEHELD